jgi:hypothetical protein
MHFPLWRASSAGLPKYLPDFRFKRANLAFMAAFVSGLT